MANLTLRDTVTPTIGELLDELEQSCKSGALAYAIIGGRLFERETGDRVAVRARFGATYRDDGTVVDLETLPLIDVLKRVQRGEKLTQLAAPPDSTTFVAVASLVAHKLVVGVRDHRGGLAAAALSSPPPRERRKVRSTQTDLEIRRMGTKSTDELLVMDAETLVLDIESQEKLSGHRERRPKSATRWGWHYWKVLRRGVGIVAEGGTRETVSGRDENERWLARAAEFEAQPAKLQHRLQLGPDKKRRIVREEELPDDESSEALPAPISVSEALSIDTDRALRALLKEDERKILELKIQETPSREIAAAMGPRYTAAKVDKTFQTVKTRLQKARVLGFF